MRKPYRSRHMIKMDEERKKCVFAETNPDEKARQRFKAPPYGVGAKKKEDVHHDKGKFRVNESD